MLRESIEKVLKGYLNNKNENFADNELAKVIRTELPEILENITKNSYLYKFQGSAGQGMWANCPWIAILDNKITNSVQSGYFPVYLFREDMRGVYLSLMFGTEDFKSKFGDNAKEEMISKASNCRKKYPEILDTFKETKIDLATDSPNSRASFYEAGTIAAKYYDVNELPTEEELISDLNDILFFYQKTKINYGLLTDQKIKELLRWFVYSSESNRKWMSERRESEKINHIWIQPEMIEKMSEEELKKYYLDYFNNGTGRKQNLIAIHRDRIIRNDNFKNSLLYLLNENIDIKKRINDLLNSKNEYHIEGMGKALITAFLMDFKPNKYCLWNSKTEDGFKALGWDKYYHSPGDSAGDIYLKILTLLEKLKELDPELALEFIDIDLFLHVIAAEEEGINELNKILNDEIINIIEPIKTILNDLPKAWAENEEVKRHPIGRVFIELSNNILKIANSVSPEKSYHAEGYYRHTDQWYKTPYVYVEDRAHKNKFSKWDQHFVEFWFPENLNGVYLTLHQSGGYASGLLKSKFGKYSEEIFNKYIENHRNLVQKMLTESGNVSDELLNEHSKATSWNDRVILGRYYDKNDLPSNDEIISNFKELFELYSLLKPDENGGVITENENSFFDYLSQKGYFFDQKIVENFLLSLKVKPFVILTGNSGTGKTKVAQLFAQYLARNNSVENYIQTFVKANPSSIKYNAWTLKRSDIKDLDLTLERDFNIKVDDLPTTAKLSMSPRLWYDDPDKKIQSLLEKISSNTPDKDIKLDLIISKEDTTKYEIIPVGANWTENRHIIGFYNVITENYQKTPALNLIINAFNEYEIAKGESDPYFLILDEMNLSHVERYFSDFLSAMESNEEIELHKAVIEEVEINETIKLPPQKIKISPNLMVIGTVNIDETTYMFSPKVLDRANTLEFLTQPAEDYMSRSPEYSIKGDLDYLQDPLSDIDIRDENIIELKNRLFVVKTTKGQDLWEVLFKNIGQFQKILKRADFDFGFRTINEIVRFMFVAWKYEKKPNNWDNWERYFDAQIMQKMLPKLHGSQKELANVLEELENQCNKGNFPTSTKKIMRMRKTLQEKRYVAFTG
jgi:energy-coupling factor transporter ATP-binding protein EcfA2